MGRHRRYRRAPAGPRWPPAGARRAARPHWATVTVTRVPAVRCARESLGAIGRMMIAAGVLILLFVAYQLWGTGLHTAQAQDELASRVRGPAGAARPSSPATPPRRRRRTATTSAPTTTLAATGAAPDRRALPPPEPGDAHRHHPDPADRRRLLHRRGRRPAAGCKEGPGHYPDAAARPGRQRRPRRPPHHLRRPVQPHRRARAGRPDHRSRPCRARSPTRCCPSAVPRRRRAQPSGHRIVAPDADRDPRPGQGRQPAHADGLPPEVQRRASASSSSPSSCRNPAPPTDAARGGGRRRLGHRRRLDRGPRRRRPAGARAPAIALVRRRPSASGSSPGSPPGGGRLAQGARATSSGRPIFFVVLFLAFENINQLLPAGY